MEFVQFHPTALALEGAPRFLISEAVRGEGAPVVAAHGERFLFASDQPGEPAPPDGAAPATWRAPHPPGAPRRYLDCPPPAGRAARGGRRAHGEAAPRHGGRRGRGP